MNKTTRHALIRARAQYAIKAMYHNATPNYPRLDGDESDKFGPWFENAALNEIDYIAHGGASPGDYRATLAHPANGGKLKSEKARRYYIAKGLRGRDEERARCNSLDSRVTLTNAMWERITEYGALYSYGRGGRTLAPSDLVNDRGPSFGMRQEAACDMNMESCVELIRIVESFNAHVAAWCKGVPEMFAEYYNEEFGGADVETVAVLSDN